MSEEILTEQLEQLVAMLPEGAEKPVSISEIATRLNYQQTYNHGMGGVPD
ncbi:MAG TPA: hypothetical protein K8V38_05585 [Weissella cibaria]|nr:hypothetical protein [Weissella cibaria]